MHLEDFDILDVLDRLIAGDGGQVQCGAGLQLEGVHTRATIDDAACAQLGLHRAHFGGDHVVAPHARHDAAVVGHGINARCAHHTQWGVCRQGVGVTRCQAQIADGVGRGNAR